MDLILSIYEGSENIPAPISPKSLLSLPVNVRTRIWEEYVLLLPSRFDPFGEAPLVVYTPAGTANRTTSLIKFEVHHSGLNSLFDSAVAEIPELITDLLNLLEDKLVFCFDNPENVEPFHHALYTFFIQSSEKPPILALEFIFFHWCGVGPYGLTDVTFTPWAESQEAHGGKEARDHVLQWMAALKHLDDRVGRVHQGKDQPRKIFVVLFRPWLNYWSFNRITSRLTERSRLVYVCLDRVAWASVLRKAGWQWDKMPVTPLLMAFHADQTTIALLDRNPTGSDWKITHHDAEALKLLGCRGFWGGGNKKELGFKKVPY